MRILILLSAFVTFVLAQDTSVVSSRFYSIGTVAKERECDSSTSLFIPTWRGFPLYEIPIGVTRDTLRASRGSTVAVVASADSREILNVKRETYYVEREKGVDVTVEPLLWFQFGRFDDPVENASGVTPRVKLYLWRGAQFDLRSYFTIRDELHTKAGFQGGTAVLSQSAKLFDKHWITGSFGWFTAERWGTDFTWNGLFLDNRLITEIETGVTGGIAWQDSIFRFTAFDAFTTTISAGWIVGSLNLLIEGELGRYLHGDFGGGGSLKRRFGIVDIALTALYTDLGVNGGFSVSVPLWFGKHPSWRSIRYGLADRYRFRYRFKGYTPPAHRYETGVDLKEKLWEFHSSHF